MSLTGIVSAGSPRVTDGKECSLREKNLDLLLGNPIFSTANIAHEGFLTYRQRIALSVERAKAVVKAYSLTQDEIENVRQPFWDLHASAAGIMDSAAGTLVTIQVNLFAGTLAKYTKDHPAHKRMLDEVLRFDVLAHYCLTEVDHGLDAINIETRATMLSDGSFVLHTPHPGASKIMPPTAPCGIPAVGIVFAKLIANDEDRGIRPFVLNFNDGVKSSPGIVSRPLPPRDGSPPVFHSITSFNNVKLPPHSLLGAATFLSRAALRENHLATIWRTSVGAIALGSSALPIIERTAFIAGRYSQRRTVGMMSTKETGSRIPILYFRTQHGPILKALAYALVFRHFWRHAIRMFTDEGTEMNVRMAWATVFKATISEHAVRVTSELASRCGAQGLFYHNNLSSAHSSVLGLQIAEGDVLGLCIRLASELLLGRYTLPEPSNPDSALAQREQSLMDNSRQILFELSTNSEGGASTGKHRSSEFNERILPRCERIVHSIGHRMAWESAVAAGEDSRVTNLYVAAVMSVDSVHDTEVEGALNKALKEALPCLDEWLDRTGVEKYCQVPILTKANWTEFVGRLPVYDSTGLLPAKL